MKFRIALAALVIAGAAFCAVRFGVSPKEAFLEMRDADSGKIYGKWPLKETDVFAVEFIHSVHQSPVKESFIIGDKMIRPIAVRFSSFGAGMQSNLEEGQVLSRDGEDLLITGFTSSFKELNYIVGTVSDHVLYIKGKEISLRTLCGKNAHITMRYHGGKEQ